MLWLWIAVWSLIVVGLLALAFLLAVGAAISGRKQPAGQVLIAVMLTPAINVSRGNPFVFLPVMWLVWTLLGVAVIVGLRSL